MLDLFWNSHSCDRTNHSRQYMNAVFYRDDAQKSLAEASFIRRAEQLGMPESKVKTTITPVEIFTYAEGYHQKYYLTRYSELRDFLNTTYSDGKALGDSTVATRLNAYLGAGMERDWGKFRSELPKFGLPEKLAEPLLKMADAQVI